MYEDGKEIAFTGGKHKRDWSGLEEPLAYNTFPGQLRPQGPKSETSFNNRAKGLENKFHRHGDLPNFIAEFKEHCERYGLIPITYRDDPANETEVASVLDDYSKYRLAPLRESSKKTYKHYDPYAKSDDVCGKLFLFASLEATLAHETV